MQWKLIGNLKTHKEVSSTMTNVHLQKMHLRSKRKKKERKIKIEAQIRFWKLENAWYKNDPIDFNFFSLHEYVFILEKEWNKTKRAFTSCSCFQSGIWKNCLKIAFLINTHATDKIISNAIRSSQQGELPSELSDTMREASGSAFVFLYIYIDGNYNLNRGQKIQQTFKLLR